MGEAQPLSESTTVAPFPSTKSTKQKGLLTEGYYEALKKRRLSEETCRFWGYQRVRKDGKVLQVANYYGQNRVPIAQKVRYPDKSFTFLGDAKEVGLYGQWLWRDGGKMIVLTEGELDAITVSHLQNNKWPVCSVSNGAQGAAKSIKKSLDWLSKFDKVVFMFDQDEPGKAAVEECVQLLPPGKAFVASLPLKDASEMHQAGRGSEVIDAIWGAKEWRPDAIVSVSDVWDEAVALPERGIEWPWPTLTELTYGIHRKCSYYLGAGVGIGKTDWAKELQSHLVNKKGLKVGVFMLEESVGKTLKGIAGKFVGKQFHRPDGSFTQEELEKSMKSLEGKVFLYNHYGVKDWDSIKAAIRFMVISLDIKDIFLDNLTALVSHLSASEANDEINRIAGEIAGLVHELDFTLYGFSHLNSPRTGEPHERGGKVHENQFTGSRGLMRYGNYLFGLQRSKDPELSEIERNTTTFVLLKDREYGNSGSFKIYYDKETGTYLERPDFFEEDDGPTPDEY